MPSIRASRRTVPCSLIYPEYRKTPLEEPFLRRLFSSFARGWPGAGLLFIRIVAATALLDQAVNALQRGAPHESTALAVLAQPGDPWTYILLGSIGTALALLGPGAWSIDAHIFGWKRIDIRDRQG